MGVTSIKAVFPTQVGVILLIDLSDDFEQGIPHASGGDPIKVVAEHLRDEYSPRKWG